MIEKTPPDTWAATILELGKLEGRNVMGSQRLMPGASRAGKTKANRDGGMPEAHLGDRYGALLE